VANPRDRITRVVNKIHRTLFTLSKGRIGGRLRGMPIVLLTTTGRKSGEPRQNMVGVPLIDGDRLVLVASFGGAPNHPQWFLNLKARPRVEVTREGRTSPMEARVAEGPEREELWQRVVASNSDIGKHQTQITREIPVVVLEPWRQTK
jgi:deazaflavin-dependent oxidoreductase (nitroreductase family)